MVLNLLMTCHGPVGNTSMRACAVYALLARKDPGKMATVNVRRVKRLMYAARLEPLVE